MTSSEMKRRGDGVLVGKPHGVDCCVSRFNPQDAAPYKWECILGAGDSKQAQIRVKGGAPTEEEATRSVLWYAVVIHALFHCTHSSDEDFMKKVDSIPAIPADDEDFRVVDGPEVRISKETRERIREMDRSWLRSVRGAVDKILLKFS